MNADETVDIAALSPPEELIPWISNARLYESSGQSGARTVFIHREEGAYLKIAERGALHRASTLQAYFAQKGMSSPVLFYLSADRDYLITAALQGEDGTAARYIADPRRLCDVYGNALRALHEVDAYDCPIRGRMAELSACADSASFQQAHLDLLSNVIGPAKAEHARAEIAEAKSVLRDDVLIHGDYCLPNIILDDWRPAGFIDVADGGFGDRHYDLVWGLWTLGWNLKTPDYAHRFLDAYGRDRIDVQRLRVCGLLAAMD